MTSWTNIPDGNLEPGSPIRSADGLALRENPIAIAERANNAPRVAPNSHQKLTGSGSFTVPDGVTRLSVHVVGAGGGGDGSDGGWSTMGGVSTSGGQGGTGHHQGQTGGIGTISRGGGGSPGTGSYNPPGGDSGFGGGGGESAWGYGRTGYKGVDGFDGYKGNSGFAGGGGSGGSTDSSGAGGGYGRGEINVTPGESIRYVCGSGGTGGGNSGNGGNGFIIVEY